VPLSVSDCVLGDARYYDFCLLAANLGFILERTTNRRTSVEDLGYCLALMAAAGSVFAAMLFAVLAQCPLPSDGGN